MDKLNIFKMNVPFTQSIMLSSKSKLYAYRHYTNLNADIIWRHSKSLKFLPSPMNKAYAQEERRPISMSKDTPNVIP